MTTLDLALAPSADLAATVALCLAEPEIAAPAVTRRSAEIAAPAAYQASEVTMMTTSKTAAGNLYPFTTKAQIKARLDSDPAFRVETMCLLHTLQTEHEQATLSTLSQNRQGFMSSHAVWGSKIAVKVKAHLAGGGTIATAMALLTAEEWGKVDAIAPRYSRQLAAYHRAKEIAENPALKATAELFSAG